MVTQTINLGEQFHRYVHSYINWEMHAHPFNPVFFHFHAKLMPNNKLASHPPLRLAPSF